MRSARPLWRLLGVVPTAVVVVWFVSSHGRLSDRAAVLVLALVGVSSVVLHGLRRRFDGEYVRRMRERRAFRRRPLSEDEALKGYPTWW